MQSGFGSRTCGGVAMQVFPAAEGGEKPHRNRRSKGARSGVCTVKTRWNSELGVPALDWANTP